MFAPHVIGHNNAKELLSLALSRPHHAYLMVGPPGVGVHSLSEAFVRALVGVGETDVLRAHPDVVVLESRDGTTGEITSGIIPVEAVRAIRMRMAHRPQIGPRSVAYITHADRLNEEGTNALLKSLEEPEADGVYVLAAYDESRIPATIKSRVITIRLGTVPLSEIDTWLTSRGVASGDRSAAVDASAGRPAWALRWIENTDWRAQRRDAELLVARLLQSSISAGDAVSAIEPLAKRCESADDVPGAWREAVGMLQQALSSLLVTHTAQSSHARVMHLGHALIAAQRAMGSPISPRLWLELALVRASSGAPPIFPQHLPSVFPYPL